MKVTYYLEVVSSWCTWAEPMWAELKSRYASRGVNFEWKIALMNPQDFPISAAQCDWYYRRSGMVMRSPFMLNSAWMEFGRKGAYDAPNLIAEAGKDLGFEGDELRLALAHAAVREGRKVGDWAETLSVATKVTKLSSKKLRAAAESKEIKARVAASTAEFHAHQISQRPAFIVTDAIGDKAVFSGLARIEPLAATIEAMMADTAAYAGHTAHFGKPPAS